MQILKKPSNIQENNPTFYHSDDDSKSKAKKSFKKFSDVRSNSSSSNEIVFLGEFPQENLYNQAFSYKEEEKNSEFNKIQSMEDKNFSIKVSEGFTFVEFFDFKQFQCKNWDFFFTEYTKKLRKFFKGFVQQNAIKIIRNVTFV